MNLSKNAKFINALAARAESTTINSAIVDLANAEGCCFIVTGSTALGSASATFQPQMSTANSTAALSNTAGTLTSTKMVAGANYHVAIIDCYKPTERYLRLQINGTSSGYVNSITAVLYGIRKPGSTALVGSTHYAGSTCIAGLTT